jgi:hypothetical protein
MSFLLGAVSRTFSPMHCPAAVFAVSPLKGPPLLRVPFNIREPGTRFLFFGRPQYPYVSVTLINRNVWQLVEPSDFIADQATPLCTVTGPLVLSSRYIQNTAIRNKYDSSIGRIDRLRY